MDINKYFLSACLGLSAIILVGGAYLPSRISDLGARILVQNSQTDDCLNRTFDDYTTSLEDMQKERIKDVDSLENTFDGLNLVMSEHLEFIGRYNQHINRAIRDYSEATQDRNRAFDDYSEAIQEQSSTLRDITKTLE